MERSLTALLPVHNAQSTLSRIVLELLDVLSELTRRLEICIIDTCSSDDTIEVADELAACYPQVQAIRQSARRPHLAAIHAGLAHSTGEIIFLSGADCTLSADEIHRLWWAAEDHEVVLGVAHTPHTIGKGRKPRGEAARGGFVMLHRQVCNLLRQYLATPEELRNFLATNQLQWQEVEIRDRGREPWRRMHLERAVQSGPVLRLAADPSGANSGRPPRPNYLEELRDFALGE